VKNIGQKYRSNRALGNFDRSPNPRTQGNPRTLVGTRGPWGPIARSTRPCKSNLPSKQMNRRCPPVTSFFLRSPP
jgi:hypothetical protein